MHKVLCCWLGSTDLKCCDKLIDGLGPICHLISEVSFDEVYILSNFTQIESKKYTAWLRTKTTSKISQINAKLSSPTNFTEISEHALKLVEEIKTGDSEAQLYFHLSPGTPAMAAVWIIISKTQYPAILYQTSVQEGVKVVSIPFEMSAEFIKSVDDDDIIMKMAGGILPEHKAFKDIVHQSREMKHVIAQAQLVAGHNVPVLIQGESGTGKELLAKAIHGASSRNSASFIPVNCGAIPESLAESEFFGYEKDAFTGAHKAKKGYLEEANDGTLFLDEIGELPLNLQVKLLRALQEKEVTRVGATKPVKVNVRIIAATNRNLFDEVHQGRFREDLFHRLAVGVIQLPPLRSRKGDISLLIDKLLEQINHSFVDSNKNWKHKKISASAKNVMIKYTWPGNIRELINTLTRALLWSPGDTIQADDINSAILQSPASDAGQENILSYPFEENFNIDKVIDEVKISYIKRALKEAGGKLNKASDLLGLKNYQTLKNWLKKYDLNSDGT
ncbi:MAG: sigma-54-dependent Fis family transcriptional regulator [Victivallales bacterium]|nr:sigma-54-dependent Fis family transcriptional regulator [Victivallales bacterium]